jgi:hypothetical protein
MCIIYNIIDLIQFPFIPCAYRELPTHCDGIRIHGEGDHRGGDDSDEDEEIRLLGVER